MTAAARFQFSLRALIGGVLTAAIVGTLAYLALDFEYPEQLGKLAFWTACAIGFIAVSAFALAGLRFVAAVLLGGVAGFVFAMVAHMPFGFFPGRFEAPVIMLWPATGVGALAYAASRSHKRSAHERGSPLLVVAGVLAAIAFMFGIKQGLARIAEPLDFARYQRPQPPLPRIDNIIAANPAATADSCKATALPARMLSSAGIAVDSTVRITPVGVYSNLRNADGKTFGHRVLMWRSEAADLHGILEQHTGEAQPISVMIESIDHNAPAGTLSFRAFFDDGFVADFAGQYNPGNMQGDLRIFDGSCTDRTLSTERVVLSADFDAVKTMYGAANRRTLADFGSEHAAVFRRAPAPSFPDPPEVDGVINVAHRFWYDSGTTAAAFSARFNSAADMKRFADPQQVIGTHQGKTLRLQDLLFARADDAHSNTASWILIGPTEVMRQYISGMHGALAKKDGVQHMSYRNVAVQLVDEQ